MTWMNFGKNYEGVHMDFIILGLLGIIIYIALNKKEFIIEIS